MSEPVELTNDEKEIARQWLYDHNGDEGGGLGGLWLMIEGILADRVNDTKTTFVPHNQLDAMLKRPMA